LENVYIGNDEKKMYENVVNFRKLIKDIIDERKKSNAIGDDFISLLL
jgi:hypothetical protein